MIPFNIKRVILLTAVVLIGSTSSAQVPKWAKTFKHSKYPERKYFIGIGIANDKTQAIERARSEIGAQIRVKIDSELETMESEFHEKDKAYITSEVTSRTKSMVTETISGIDIVETKKAKKRYYALAVLSKSKYLSGMRSEMDLVSGKTVQLIESARKLSDEGRVFPAVENYIDAQSVVPEFYAKSTLYTALTGERYGMSGNITGPGIMTEVRELLSAIQIINVSGNEQAALSGKYLPSPLKVRVILKSDLDEQIGVANFPVMAKYENGDLVDKKETDSDGFASFRVVAVSTDDLGENGSVVVRSNISRLPDVFKDALTNPEINFYYNIKTLDLLFSIRITDQEGIENNTLTEKVESLISQNGYSVIESAPFLVEGDISISKEKVLDIPAGKQYYIESSLNLVLMDKSTESTIASFEATGKGLDVGSRDSAIERSFKNVKFSKKKFAGFLMKAAGE